jgi:hypothetical protein
MTARIAVVMTAIGGCELAAPDPSPEPCGGAEALGCPFGHTCEDDPDDDCDPAAGDACPGVCTPTLCGGILGLPCAKGQMCVDDPIDSCDPKNGGADCTGVCAEDEPITSGCDRPNRTFVAKEQGLCDQIQFLCEAGWVHFYDACGCGCELPGA